MIGERFVEPLFSRVEILTNTFERFKKYTGSLHWARRMRRCLMKSIKMQYLASDSIEWRGVTNALERYFCRHQGEWRSIASVVALVVFVVLPIALVVIYPPSQDSYRGFQVFSFFLLSGVIAILLDGVMLYIGSSIRAQSKDFLELQSNRAELESSRDTILRLGDDMARQEEQIGKILVRLAEVEQSCQGVRVEMDAVLKSWWLKRTATELKGKSVIQTEW